MIKIINGQKKYFDRNGKEITEGCKIKYTNLIPKGKIMEVYMTEEGELGIDATNPKWIESGRAFPCEYGIYPLTEEETEDVEIVEE